MENIHVLQNTRLHLSWLIWETMVFTAHLIVNDMAFGLGNLRSMNLFSHITLGRSFSYTRIINCQLDTDKEAKPQHLQECMYII